MIVDSSALLAVLCRERDAERFDLSMATTHRLMSLANALEVAIVLESRRGAEAGEELDAFLASAEIELVAVKVEHLSAA